MKWCLFNKLLSLDDIYELKPINQFYKPEFLSEEESKFILALCIINCLEFIIIAPEKPKEKVDLLVSCPMCSEKIAGVRFAPHLERCMNGGKRGSRRHYESLQDNVKLSKSKKGALERSFDPYPNSLVVKIKLKSGGILNKCIL